MTTCGSGGQCVSHPTFPLKYNASVQYSISPISTIRNAEHYIYVFSLQFQLVLLARFCLFILFTNFCVF